MPVKINHTPFKARPRLLSGPKTALLIAASFLLSGFFMPAWAAQQGTSGTTSTGDIDVTMVVGLNVRLSGLADMPLGVWGGSGDLTADDNLCVGRTGVGFGAGNYRIYASGDGESGNPAAFRYFLRLP